MTAARSRHVTDTEHWRKIRVEGFLRLASRSRNFPEQVRNGSIPMPGIAFRNIRTHPFPGFCRRMRKRCPTVGSTGIGVGSWHQTRRGIAPALIIGLSGRPVCGSG